MAIATVKTGCFPHLFEAHFAAMQGLSKGNATTRKTALESFLKTGIPTTRHEAWKYTSLRYLNDADFKINKSCEFSVERISEHLIKGAYKVIFIDGNLANDISDLGELETGLHVKATTEFEVSNPELLADFDALNAAFVSSGISIEVDPESAINKTVQILHVNTAANAAGFVRNTIQVGRASKANVVESFVSIDNAEDSLHSSFLSINVADSASLNHVRIQNKSHTQTDVSSISAVVDKGAVYKTFTFTTNGRVTRNNLAIRLNGEQSHTELLGLALTKDEQVIDNFTSVDHALPHATSRQVYANVLKDKSRCVFTGKVNVRKDAQKTAAFQLNKNLLLSSEAEVDTRPQLQIDADDVKCSHGATVGQLNQNEIFYLQTRGIKRDVAESMIAKAFANGVLLDCPIEEARVIIESQINEYFE